MATVDLERALLLAGLTAPVRWDEVTGSTNETAMSMAADGAPEWSLVAAGHQTAGRGRLDRAWVDRPGGSLMVSVVLRPSIPIADAGLLTLLAGAAWAESATALTGRPVRCKWPNDLLIAGDKVGGILAASALDVDGMLAHVVIGSGLNLTAPPGVSGAAALGDDLDPTELLAVFLRSFREGYRPGDPVWSTTVIERWRSVADTIGRRVRARRLDGAMVEGTAADVDERGGLLVETADGRVGITLGEIEHLD
jgi:BirA family transcriptional regulator, biotin operon repressor / biotin---[acetyl-CoA-carboxylase] ligase